MKMMEFIKDSNFICDYNNSNFSNDINNNSLISCWIQIGHSGTIIQSYIIFTLSSLGLLCNTILIFNICIKSKNNKKSGEKGSMRKIFQILPIFDCFSAIYWIISSIKFQKAEQINNDKKMCSILSILYLLILSIDFCYINFILYHFKKINNNPIDGTMKNTKNMFKYFFISVGLGILLSVIAFFTKMIGRSPMVTCFINTESSIFNSIIFAPHVILLFYALFQVLVGLCSSKMFIYNDEIKNLYKRNCIYVLLFCIFHIPLLFLIFFFSYKNKFQGIISSEFLKNFLPLIIYLSTLITSMIPLIISLSRLSQGLTRFECFYKICGCCMKKNSKERLRSRSRYTMSNNFNRELTINLVDKNMLDWMDQHAIEYFMRDILIGIAYSLKNSKKFDEDLDNLKRSKNYDSTKYIEHNINFLNYNLDDDTIKKSDFLDVNITEYAPKSFALLRRQENINIDEMAESFLPMNNKKGIEESQGKSGSFFISTDDNKYMIKTLKTGEFHLLRESFLEKYVIYITDNGESLLCRLYGLYKLTMVKGEDFLFIVMRNVIGDYNKNIKLKYDIKGCTYGRKVKLDNISESQIKNLTLKDINFNEMEKTIKFKEEDIEPFISAIKKDAKFLMEMKVMDYSLFLVKIILDDDEYNELFGNKKNSYNNYIHDFKYFKKYIFPSKENNTGYILSIIDYFQNYNLKKKLESTYKVGIKLKDSESISCVSPDLYSKRFEKFMIKISGYSPQNFSEKDDDEEILNSIND